MAESHRRVLALHDVRDVQGMCASIVARNGSELSFHDEGDLVAFLVAECWRLSLRYDGSQGSIFSVWAWSILSRRIVYWKRQRFVDARYTAPPVLVPLDAADDSERDQLAAVAGADAGDPASRCDSDLAGIFDARDRMRARDFAALGLRPPRRAA
jgi:hypothetical protein